MKNIIKKLVMASVAIVFAFSSVTNADVVLTGVLDGTLTGGRPKAVELYATTDIADLSLYAIARSPNNGDPFDTITSDYILPSISLNAGDFFYAVSGPFGDQTAEFDSVFPGLARTVNFGVNSNGDDTTGLFFDATGLFTGGEALVDVFGEAGTDGTGTAWDHLDSWAYRNDGTDADGTFNINNWTVAAPNSLDGADDAERTALMQANVPFGTFVFSPVPEPGSMVVLAFVGLAGLTKRRRS